MYIKQRAIPISLLEWQYPLESMTNPKDKLVQMGNLIDWNYIENIYAAKFKKKGKPAISARIAFGLLFLMHLYRLSAVKVIKEAETSPSIQVFLGFPCKKESLDISSSVISRFSRRFTPSDLKNILKHHQNKFSSRHSDSDDLREKSTLSVEVQESSKTLFQEFINLLSAEIKA